MFFGAVQLGIMAACVVLFVPMGMAGWHLSRNKVLFFSCALFITLAVCIHLIPYFPSIFTAAPPILVEQETRTSCISLLHDINYRSNSVERSDNVDGFSWDWENDSVSSGCDFQKLGRIDASELLNGSWVVVAGDSQARLFVESLLDLVLGSEEMGSVKKDLFKRHSNYHIDVEEIGLKLDFIWAPYVTDLMGVATDFKRNATYPDVLVMGSGLWHMLHFTNSSEYGVSLHLLRDSLVSLIRVSPEFDMGGPGEGSVSSRSPHLFWLGMPTLINRMLNTEEKKEKMTNDMCSAYEQELQRSKLLRQYGGLFLLLDIRKLSEKCGVGCSLDGMHYNQAVYEASVHVMLNALLIESHQKL